MFDRDGEWADLQRFVDDDTRLGVVWGPRRAGKSTLVAALTESRNGIYYEAVRQDPALSWAEIGSLIGARQGLPAVRFDDWDQVITALITSPDCPITAIDEFGYLCESSPELPSIIQRVIDRTRRSRSRSRTGRLLLCGSAVTQLSHLLDRDQPLFGRAQLALVVDSFDFRDAARYWGIADQPRLALAVHAVVGGLPGYRDILGDAPSGRAGFDRWIEQSVLAASSPLLEEDSLVFQASGLDANIYRSILTAVAGGEQTPTHISSRIGRNVSSLARPVENLVQAGLLHRVVDPLRSRRSRYELADPFLSFYHAVIRPNRTRLRRRQQRAVWAESETTWRARLLGPHFERLARVTVERHGDELGLGAVAVVGSTTVADPASRTNHEIDVLALSSDGRIVAIGEAKHTSERRGLSDVARLDRIKALLPAERAGDCKLMLFAANGVHAAVAAAGSARDDLEIIDLSRLYGNESTNAAPGRR